MSQEKAATFENYTNEEMELRISRSETLKNLKNNPLKIGEYGLL